MWIYFFFSFRFQLNFAPTKCCFSLFFSSSIVSFRFDRQFQTCSCRQHETNLCCQIKIMKMKKEKQKYTVDEKRCQAPIEYLFFTYSNAWRLTEPPGATDITFYQRDELFHGTQQLRRFQFQGWTSPFLSSLVSCSRFLISNGIDWRKGKEDPIRHMYTIEECEECR